ncbi:MAG: hypothetical protein O9320_20620 [Magnetospirillum sp.]|nr:hypothetical protein [Magnetospirillum sp.]
MIDIVFHVTVSSNSVGYLRYMLANYRNLADRPERLKFHAYSLDWISGLMLGRNFGIDALTKLPYARGSSGHATAVQAALRNTDATAIHVIADSDTVIFAKGWDTLLAEAVGPDGQYGMIGAPYEDTGSVNAGDTPYQQYKKKPTAAWLALSPRFDFRSLEVMPDKKNFIEIADDKLSDTFQMPRGSFVVKDVGWQIPMFLKQHAIPYAVFDLLLPTDKSAVALKGTSSYHHEFHWHSAPYLAHQRGSMKHRFRIDPLSVDFYDACDRFLGQPGWRVGPILMDRAVAPFQNVYRQAEHMAKAVLKPAKTLKP